MRFHVQEETGTVLQLYHNVMDLLKDFPNLVEEFVGFLLPHQALEVNRFMDYIFYDKAWKFFSKSDVRIFKIFVHSELNKEGI